MALFKISRGNSATLPSTMTDGWAYFCTDTGEFFIDYADSNGTLHRKQINAKDAEKITGYDIKTILNSSDVEIPTSKAVLDALSVKADVADLPIIKDASAGTISLTWDGEIGDKDHFQFGTWTYCKQSDMAPAYSSVTNGYTFRSNGMQNTSKAEGVNCYAVGDAVVVTSAGTCSKGGTQFEAPSTGIYFGRMSGWYTEELEMDCDISYMSLATTDVNGTQHKIAVDENNLMSVTNMSNNTVDYVATTSYVDSKLSESTNPDWDESDPSSKAYIENRPFYTDKATLLQEDSLTVVKETYYNYYSYEYEGDAVPFIPVEGAIYTVIFNGTTYVCSVKMNGNNTYIGNDVKNDVFVSGQEPFQMFYSNYWKSLKVNTKTLGPHSITVIINEIRKLDDKYLPDNLSRTDVTQIISAENTFTVSPIVPDPADDGHATNKSYVDTQIETSVTEAVDDKLMIVKVTPYVDGTIKMSHTFDEIYDAAVYNKIIMLRYAGDWTHYFLTEYTTSAVYFSAVMPLEAYSSAPMMSYVIINSNGNITKDEYATIRLQKDIGVLPGQTIKVKSLSAGLPSDWEAVDIPSIEGLATETYVNTNFALKSEIDNIDLSAYYTKTEIDNLDLITVEDIDAICGGAISYAEDVMF